MILIADSGSTKTDWVFLGKTQQQFVTVGFNPFYRDVDFIVSEIVKNKELFVVKDKVLKLYFYGAGCSSDERKKTIINALTKVFDKSKIYVEHDLTACAHALYDGEPVIANIIGTGTNTCFFDGKILTQAKPSLGYILGDEGSGAHIGQQVIKKYLYKEFSDELMRAFDTKYSVSQDELLEHIYMKEGANTYLASFSPFCSENLKHKQIQNLLLNSFELFFKTHVLCYENCNSIKIGFVGSTAFYYQDILKTVAKSLNLEVGLVLQKPMEGLIKYHQQQL